MHLPHGLWLIIADGAKFLVLENEGEPDHPRLRVIETREESTPPTRALGTDRPGRWPDPGPNARSALAATDWHRLGEARFARLLADRLEAWARAGRFGALMIVADPRTLGTLRPALGSETRARLRGTIGRDLTNMPVPEIAALLAAA